MAKAPFNLKLLNMDDVIKTEHLREVTSEFIKESSTNMFHPEGLFSEQIFGPIASQKRLETGGYIKLNCRVFHPVVYQNIRALKRFYVEIMAGNSYAIWDADEADFVRASETERGANTGFTFFLKYFNQINFVRNRSIARDDRIDVITKFKKECIIDKFYVIPAGIRDMKDDQGKMEKDSVNSIYASLLRNAKSMTKGADTNSLFDTVHYNIQKKIIEIYEYVQDIVKGKHGFFEGKYSHRSIARGTRNVITATDLEASSPESPQYHKVDEVKVPLYQAAKGGANYLVYWYKTMFFDQIVNLSSENSPLINPKTLKLEYVPLDTKYKDGMLTADGIEKIIDRFRDIHYRFRPVSVFTDGKPYWLYLVYDDNDRINIFRNIDEFKARLAEVNRKFDEKKVHPLTHAEMLYIVAYYSFKGRCGTVTRYPVEDEQNIFVGTTHITTTSPARIVRLCNDVVDTPGDTILPEYPKLNAKFLDVLMLHPTRLKSLGADFDGNCLIGSTKVEVRFTDEWVDSCSKLAKQELHTDQDVVSVIDGIQSKVYLSQQPWYYAEITMDSMPQLGVYTNDKHGARVYDIPYGIEILSYDNEVPTYLPVTKVTVEDSCPVTDVMVGGRSITVSTNESIAIFDHTTGKLKKVRPDKLTSRQYIPYINESIHARYTLQDMSYTEGYSAASTNKTLSEINGFILRCMPEPALAGYFSSIVDKFGRIIDDKSTLGLTIMFNVNTTEDEDGIKKLLYAMGIKYCKFTKDSMCMVVVNAYNLHNYQHHLAFKNRMNAAIYAEFVKSYRSVPKDFIPVTQDEANMLNDKFIRAFKFDTAASVLTELRVDRHLGKVAISKDEDTPLSRRLYADDVSWDVAIVTPRTDECRVYDFIVPQSKVFAVNDGLIVYDTCSWIPIFSDEATKECAKYIHAPGNYLLPSGDPLADMCDDILKISMCAMTRASKELKK